MNETKVTPERIAEIRAHVNQYTASGYFRDTDKKLSDLLSALDESAEEVKRLRGLIGRLAPEQATIFCDADGANNLTCYYCDGAQGDNDDPTSFAQHAPDCPWVEARKELGNG